MILVLCRSSCRNVPMNVSQFCAGLLMVSDRLGAVSSRNFQPLVDDVRAAGLTECGTQVEGPVVSCACPDEVVLMAHLVRALQD